MKLFILVIACVWSFGGVWPSTWETFSSPEEAAIYVWRTEQATSFQFEPDQRKYSLYEVNLAKGTLIEIDIPQLSFKKEEVNNAR